MIKTHKNFALNLRFVYYTIFKKYKIFTQTKIFKICNIQHSYLIWTSKKYIYKLNLTTLNVINLSYTNKNVNKIFGNSLVKFISVLGYMIFLKILKNHLSYQKYI